MTATEALHLRTDCTHCGLPVPKGLLRQDSEHQFCCTGCETVHGLITGSGLGAYYGLRDALPGRPAAEPRGFEEFDDQTFTELHVEERPDGLRQTSLFVEGVHCSACLWLIEKSLQHEKGVGEARLAFARRRLSLIWDPRQTSLGRIAARLGSLGYQPHPIVEGSDERRKEERRLLIRLGVAGAVAGNVMLMAAALYGGWAFGMAEEHRQLFRVLSLVATLPAVLYSAAPFFRGAASGLRMGVLHMDLPISIGIGAGFLSGAYNALRGQGEVYFDSVAALIFLLLLGRLLQTWQQRRAAESSELLHTLAPAFATRLEADGRVRRVAMEAVRPGDRVQVQPDERIPADGVVERGRSTVDLAWLTGESVPVAVEPGAEVFGGSINQQSELVVRVRRSIERSRVGKVARLIADAGRMRAPIVQLADRVAGVFVGVVLLLAAGTYLYWHQLDPAAALDHAVALLIVSCPCALGLATPLSITAAVGKAARRGILVRSGEALERLGALREVPIFFDKTGTLTEARMEVAFFDGPEWVRPLAAAAEAETSHPIGRALRALAPEAPAPSRVEELPGRGVCAKVEGQEVVVGRPDFVREHGLGEVGETPAWMTPVWVAVDGRIVARMGVSDRIRPEAKQSLTELVQAGFQPIILSGDDPRVVHAVGSSLGFAAEDCRGGLSPEDKLEFVRRHPESIMVGDGVNDAAALSAAAVGVAVHGGAETCLSAADVFLQRPGVGALLDLIDGARRTRRTIRNAIVFSLCYNLCGAALAISGQLNPLVAAVLMPLSSLVVVSHAFGFRFGRPAKE
ncbi:MAG: heavy metal translocating P-type ATPase [Myxococcota bacterium]